MNPFRAANLEVQRKDYYRSISGSGLKIVFNRNEMISLQNDLKKDPEGWRLPTIDELSYLHFFKKNRIGGFDSEYWSSSVITIDPLSTKGNWVFSMEFGNKGVYSDLRQNAKIRLVRDL